MALVPSAEAARPPAVLFTDLTAGPVTGGVHGLGAPVAIFGTGFGAARGNSTVTIGGVEVAAYLVWGERNAHNPTLDLIVVEPGPAIAGGAVVVTVNGQPSAPAASFVPSGGNVHVIAPQGVDAGACGLDAPCRTLAHVLTNLMQPGDVTLARGGVYDESEVWVRDEYGHSGTAARPKAVVRYPGEEPLFANAARPLIVDANHIVLSGLRFANGKSVGVGSESVGRQGNRLIDLTFIGVIAWDAIGVHGDDNVLAGNVCQVSGSTVGTQGHCYYLSFGRGNRLRYNIGSGAPGYGIHVFDQKRQTNDLQRVIADLVLEGNILSGSTERSGMILAMEDEGGLGNVIDGVVIRNNVFTGNNHLGLLITGRVRNVQVLNNTFSRNGRQGLHVASLATVTGVTVQNNLFDEGANNACAIYCSWYEPAHAYVGGLAQMVSLSTNYQAAGLGVIGAVDGAPVTGPVSFLDAASLDYRPAAGSAVIDAGLALTAVPTDYTGLTRPQGLGHDIGAFEYVAGDTPPPPAPAALSLANLVSGATVTLGWTARGAVAGPFDLEGRAHATGPILATARAAASPVVVPGVAEGVYYVRVAGTTLAGTRVVSNQTRVVVGTGCEMPEPPAGFGATVAGPVVQFAWTLAGPGATTVDLAGGFTPGRTDIGPVDVGPAPLAVTAPPGRYFVRARTRNACGASPFTTDIEVRVGFTG